MSEPHNVDEPEQRIWDRYWRENSLPDEDEARAKVHYFAGYAARMRAVQGENGVLSKPLRALTPIRVGGCPVWSTAEWDTELWDVMRDGEMLHLMAHDLRVGDKIPCDKDEEGNHRWQEISGIDEEIKAKPTCIETKIAEHLAEDPC